MEHLHTWWMFSLLRQLLLFLIITNLIWHFDYSLPVFIWGRWREWYVLVLHLHILFLSTFENPCLLSQPTLYGHSPTQNYVYTMSATLDSCRLLGKVHVGQQWEPLPASWKHLYPSEQGIKFRGNHSENTSLIEHSVLPSTTSAYPETWVKSFHHCW